MNSSKIVEREIVRSVRIKLREYFPKLQSYIDENIITKNDWLFFGMIQLNLIKCFITSPEDAIRKSKAQINQITKYYELETRVRKVALSSNSFLKENNLDSAVLMSSMLFYDEHRSYWKKRKSSSELYFNYEIFLFLYYKWMKSFELERDNTISLVLEIMNISNYYSKNYFNFDRLSADRIVLMTEMKVSSGVLLNETKNGENIIGAQLNGNDTKNNKFIREINAHL